MANRDIRVAYRGGRFVPLDPVEYAEGTTLTITVHEEPEGEACAREALIRESFGALKGLIDREAFHEYLRESREMRARPEPKLP